MGLTLRNEVLIVFISTGCDLMVFLVHRIGRAHIAKSRKNLENIIRGITFEGSKIIARQPEISYAQALETAYTS